MAGLPLLCLRQRFAVERSNGLLQGLPFGSMSASSARIAMPSRPWHRLGSATGTVVNLGYRRIERRAIQVSDDVSGYSRWLRSPGVRPVLRIRRESVYKKDG